MSKRPLTLALSAAFSMMVAANAQAATILIGGTSLTLVYDEAAGTICDSGGCDAYYSTSDFADTASLTSLDFEIDGNAVGSIDDPPNDINVDVYLTGVTLTPGGGLQLSTISGGLIDFYTTGPDGFDYLQLDVVSGGVAYSLSGLSVNIAAAMDLFNQQLSYSFGSFTFTDPDISWAFSSASSITTATGFNATGTPDWQDDSVQFDTPVPEPASMLLLGTGLLGSAGLARLRRRRNK